MKAIDAAAGQTPEAADEAALWLAWTSFRDLAAREKLASRYLWLAKAVALKVFRDKGRQADLDVRDLIQAGSMGLLEALDRYDPALSDNFAVYAKKRVHGSIMDTVDQHSERRAQIAMSRIRRKERVESIAGSSDSRDSMRELMEVAVGIAIGLMLEGTAMFADDTAAESATAPYRSSEIAMLREQFRQIVESLPERQRDVVRYHYYFDIPFVDIGQLLGVTKARVSQIHAAALRELKIRFESAGSFDELG